MELPVARISHPMGDDASTTLTETKTDLQVIRILDQCALVANNLLVNNHALFVTLIEAAFTKETLTPSEVCDIFAKHGIQISVKKPRETLIHSYVDKYQEFLKQSQNNT
jgi:hypothetical protein